MKATVLEKMRRAALKSGLTYHQIGVRMQYPGRSARQAVWNILNRENVSVAMLTRFAKAIGVEPGSLL